ncbi:Protein CBG18626 [Caenorhabditis briggsae]|uniref:Protein CBG18626 n=1 Tax=Caenorhabditis briggsae TaxID=6238 RepID=A8XTR2_CAEBR|nr:Protein CBG18626 [Caenorhabditis briggsae]CAP36038.2 Protein CBG18626 [Caenorhabditis briggsae]
MSDTDSAFKTLKWESWKMIHQLASAILIWTLIAAMVLPIIVTPIYISVFRSNRERDRTTPVYPITYYFYKMVYAFYLTIIFLFLLYRYEFLPTEFYSKCLAAVPVLFAVHLVHVHHILISCLAIQRFLLYFFQNSEKFVSFGLKTTTKIIYLIHFVCFIPFPAAFLINKFILNDIYDMREFSMLLSMTYIKCLNWIIISSALLYIPIHISIYRLRHLQSIEKQKPHKYILYQTIILFCFKIVESLSLSRVILDNREDQLFAPTVADIFVTPSLVQVPYLFCNRRNVQAMRKRLSLKYVWSKIRNRNNRVGGINNSNNQDTISYIQSRNV